MPQRSNKTAAEILALAPINALNDGECVGWFATCYRWATIEQYEPLKETAWLGLKESDRLCKRDIYLLTLKKELQAYIDVYSTEKPTPEPIEPVEPDIEEQELSTDSYYDYPEKGDRAGSPDINDMPVLPTA